MSGPSGAGKTYSALLVAKGIAGDWSKIAVIDTENGSGELYSDLGEYNIITLDAPYSPERYIEAIKAAEDAGMEVIIIDSVTHEWDGKGGCLEINENLASAKFKGNTWAAWSETTPRHRKFLEAILTSPAHIITTARAKTDTIQTEDKKIKKVGLKEIQREGYEYELTLNFTIDRENHLAIASKDRTKLFIDRDPFLITEETGKELRAWNEGGAVNIAEQKRELVRHLRRLDLGMPTDKQDAAEFVRYACKKLTGKEPTDDNLQEIIDKLVSIHDPKEANEKVHGKPADKTPEEPKNEAGMTPEEEQNEKNAVAEAAAEDQAQKEAA